MKFKVSKAKDQKFSSGLRGFFQYRDLGINDATSGDFGANVIKATVGEHSMGDWHYHKLKFQMVYILKGWVKFEYEEEGEVILREGSSVLQPPGIKHREISHSDDLELIEICSPAEFETTLTEST